MGRKVLRVSRRLLLQRRFGLRFQFLSKIGAAEKKKKKKRLRKKGGDDIFHLASPRHPPQPSIIQHTSGSNSLYHPLLLYTEPPTCVSTLCLFSLLSGSSSPAPSPLPRYDLRDVATRLRNVKNPSVIHIFFSSAPLFLSFKNSNFSTCASFFFFFFLGGSTHDYIRRSRPLPESSRPSLVMHMQDLTFSLAGAQSQTDGHL